MALLRVEDQLHGGGEAIPGFLLDGELALSGETLLAPLRHALERSALAGAHGVPEVVQGELGEEAELTGCLALAIESVGLDTEVRALSAVTRSQLGGTA